MKHSTFLFFLLLFIVSVQFAQAETLKVGVSANYPPVAFKSQGQVVGVEPDLSQYVGQITQMDVQLIEIPWSELESALNEGKVDVVMSGVSVTSKRKEKVDFANSYMKIGQMVLIKADKIMSLSSKVSMHSTGRRFGVENKTTGQQYAEAEFSHSQITAYDSIEEGIQALKSEEIDYFIHDAPTVWQYTVLPATQDKELFGLYEYMTDEPLAWAVKKGNKTLLDKLNKALEIMKSRGLVNKTINQWIPLKIEVGQ